MEHHGLEDPLQSPWSIQCVREHRLYKKFPNVTGGNKLKVCLQPLRVISQTASWNLLVHAGVLECTSGLVSQVYSSVRLV